MKPRDFITEWEQAKMKLKSQYPHLTEDDLEYQIGKEEELLQRLEKKTGKTRDEITKWLHIMG
ncbi:CsbD family protein [Polluticoccus soli]|uniref:CsbD family protein n=1 Tax=Polluticoccus soli TaxID=3034150 RepID=UPI0023E11660|nr:CsbD family protein [Flavipsychrobacter sp. JY13-12]